MYLEVHDPENHEDIRKSVQIILDAVKTLPKKTPVQKHTDVNLGYSDV